METIRLRSPVRQLQLRRRAGGLQACRFAWQAEMIEDAAHARRRGHCGEDLHSPIALGTFEHVAAHPINSTLKSFDKLLAKVDAALKVAA
jgi:hypothetical protein